MNPFTALGDPARRRIVELLAQGERSAGSIGDVISEEFGISQPAVSNHLRTLRTGGLVSVSAQGSRRIYRLTPGALQELLGWVETYGRLWSQVTAEQLAAEQAERGGRHRGAASA